MESSPVGVVVFDAQRVRAVSVNRQPRPIVNPLRGPGQPPAALLDALTFQRGDGRKVALEEFPLANALGSAETVRTDERVLSVPDRRRDTAPVNATRIRSDDGTVVSTVVTIQDLAPLEALERARLLCQPGKPELRVPLMSIKGSAATLLRDGGELDPAEMRAFHRIIRTQAGHMRSSISNLLEPGRIESGTLAVEPEPTDMAALLDHARNTFVSGGARHAILVDLPANHCCAGSGATATRTGQARCAFSWGSCAASSATARASPRGSSMNEGSASVCRNPTSRQAALRYPWAPLGNAADTRPKRRAPGCRRHCSVDGHCVDRFAVRRWADSRPFVSSA